MSVVFFVMIRIPLPHLVSLLVIYSCCSCVSLKTTLSDAQVAENSGLNESPKAPKPVIKRDFHRVVETTIPITHEEFTAELKAAVFRPNKMIKPKTLVIIAPGSGNVSRRQEVESDGISSYESPIELNTQWAKALADRGIFVLTYDKRTCSSQINPICQDNDQKDIDRLGIAALSSDLDQVLYFAEKNLDSDRDETRIVLMSTTQGAQTIALSQALNKVKGVVLLSPVIGDLESMWVGGLNKASLRAKSDWEKYQLQNRKESMAGFFASMKKGDFPDTAMVKGATAKFWMSWIDASKGTLEQLIKAKRPTLMLFSEKDVFSHEAPKIQEKIKQNQVLKMKIASYGDRNFIDGGLVAEPAIDDVTNFIEKLF